MRRPLLLIAILSLSACALNTKPEPRTPLAGEWLGTSQGVRVRLRVIETYSSERTWVLDGSGALIVLATGDSLPFTISGYDLGGVHVSMEVIGPNAVRGLSDTYAHFFGGVDDAGLLSGSIDRGVQNFGPFPSPITGRSSISLARQ